MLTAISSTAARGIPISYWTSIQLLKCNVSLLEIFSGDHALCFAHDHADSFAVRVDADLQRQSILARAPLVRIT